MTIVANGKIRVNILEKSSSTQVVLTDVYSPAKYMYIAVFNEVSIKLRL